MADRRVIPTEEFYDSFAEIQSSPAAVDVFRALVQRVRFFPEHGETLSASSVRVMKAHGYGPFPPLRIFYWFDDDHDIYLLDIDPYGEE
jgi:hypothetical protein